MNAGHDVLTARQHVEICGRLCEQALTIADECRREHGGHREREWTRNARCWSDEAFRVARNAHAAGDSHALDPA